DGVVRPAPVVKHDERIGVLQVAQVAVGAAPQVQDHEVAVIDGSVVGAGRDVGHAPGLVWHDADDAVPRFGDAEVLGRARRGVVGHDVATAVGGARFALFGIALLGAEVDLAAGADVVARVDLGLGGEAGRPGADDLVCVHDHAHAGRL